MARSIGSADSAAPNRLNRSIRRDPEFGDCLAGTIGSPPASGYSSPAVFGANKSFLLGIKTERGHTFFDFAEKFHQKTTDIVRFSKEYHTHEFTTDFAKRPTPFSRFAVITMALIFLI